MGKFNSLGEFVYWTEPLKQIHHFETKNIIFHEKSGESGDFYYVELKNPVVCRVSECVS